MKTCLYSYAGAATRSTRKTFLYWTLKCGRPHRLYLALPGEAGFTRAAKLDIFRCDRLRKLTHKSRGIWVLMSKRIYPYFVAMLGTLGLAASMSFLAGAYLAYQPGWEAWAEFFVPRAVYLLVIPYALLLSYLYLRAQLGIWLLRRDRVEEAIAYCEPRLEHSLMRSRGEALGNRIALARGFMARGDYGRARELLESGYKLPKRGRIRLEIARWRMEIALREENLLRCHRAFEEVVGQLRPAATRRELDACRAELAVREGDFEAYGKALGRANWKGQKLPRIQWVEVLGAIHLDEPETSNVEEGNNRAENLALHLENLDSIRDELLFLLPQVEGELLAIRTELLYRDGHVEEARQQLARLESARCDARAKYEVERVRALIETK